MEPFENRIENIYLRSIAQFAVVCAGLLFMLCVYRLVLNIIWKIQDRDSEENRLLK